MPLTTTAGFAVIGATLGLSGGLAPGPLSALVVRESLAHGSANGYRVALAPMITDAPLLLVAGGLATQLQGLNVILGAISGLGAVALTWMAWESWNASEISLQADPSSASGSAIRGVLVNLLSPHPYLFWVVIGGPLVAQAWAAGIPQTVGFLLGFFGLLCGSKMGIAWAVGANRHRISGRAYLWTMRALAGCLLLFAAGFLREAWLRLALA
jgi:threonine/homoserine/homoserine lactone efflux protein